MAKIEISGTGEGELDQFQVQATFLKLQNSYLLLVSDQPEFGIGTVTLSAPPSGISSEASSSPFNIFGMKNNILANLIGRNASKSLKVPVLSLVLIKESTLKPEQRMKVIMQAVTKAINEVEETQKQEQNEKQEQE